MILEDTLRNLIIAPLGTALNGGTINFEAVDNSVIASLQFANPAFGSASGGEITANPITPESDSPGGTVDHVTLRNSGGDLLMTLTVSLPIGDGTVKLSSLEIEPGSGIGMSVCKFSIPASLPA
jgi:hypothetical protein